MSDLPLAGVRVLDLAQVYAGPTCTRILCDLGAEVIKVEGLHRMDITRNFVIYDNKTQDDYWNRSHYFLSRNAGKKSLTLDFQEPRSIELLKRLVPEVGVLVESFTPRVMAQHGLDYESLRKIKPDLIMISLSGYGQNGPWRDYSAYGMGLEPASGISSFTGYRGSEPLRTVYRSRIPTPASWGRGPSWPPSTTGAAPARASTSTCRSRRRRSLSAATR